MNDSMNAELFLTRSLTISREKQIATSLSLLWESVFPILWGKIPSWQQTGPYRIHRNYMELLKV